MFQKRISRRLEHMRFKSIFFSHNFPVSLEQEALVKTVEAWIAKRGIVCHTVRNFATNEGPAITRIRRKIDASDAVIALALPKAPRAREGDVMETEYGTQTTPWVHMEAAMAIQAGKPLALIKDARLPQDGIFDVSATGLPVLELGCEVTLEEFQEMLDSLSFS